jgi:hypothetical protein
MDQDAEIRDLKAALSETKWAVASLAVCIAQTLAEHDPSLQKSLTRTFEQWHRELGSRARPEAKEIAAMFGRAFVDPAFPMSSIPP